MLTFRQTIDTLKNLGHNPNKSFGQNFLIDKNIVDRAIRLAEIKQGEKIVEVGPGLGTLSGAILAAGGDLTAIETDNHLIEYLKETFPTINLIHADATKVDYQQFQPFKVVANLPYAVSSPLLERFVIALPTRMVLMVQREMAERYLATAGKAFSALSIVLQSAYKAKIAHAVPPTCFYPAPRVHSCLLLLEIKEKPILFDEETRKLIRSMFLNRRKQLHKAAEATEKSATWFNALVAEGKISQKARAEEIPLELWQRLAK